MNPYIGIFYKSNLLSPKTHEWRIVMTAPISPAQVMATLNIINNTISAVKEYAISHDREITERQKIRATLEVALKALDNDFKLVRQVLETKHNERMKLYEVLQISLAKSVKSNNVELVNMFTKVMLDVYDKGEHLSQLKLYDTNTFRKLTHEE